MLYISYDDQQRIKRRMKRLPSICMGQPAIILAFQTVATLILAYGVCISIYKHPIIDKKPDPACDIFIACFYYFALSVSVPFTGGHLNPSTTIAFHLHKKNKNMIYYFIAQFLGATIAALLAYWFFDVIPAAYQQEQNFWQCVLDTIGEAAGLFIVLFFSFLVTQTKYASSQYFGYLIVSIMVFIGRAFTFRKGCINPALGIAFQVGMAIKKSNPILILYTLPVIIGPTVGAILAYYVFKIFYNPLIQEVKDSYQSNQSLQI